MASLIAVQHAGEDSSRRISPPLSELEDLRTPLNPGERKVFDLLDAQLPAAWEIYVQPHLNGLRPDFVLLNPAVGIAVFEVKDWNFEAVTYSLDTSVRPPLLWGKRKSGETFCDANPIEKLFLYKSEITRLYCPGLDRVGGAAAVTAGIIFPQVSQDELDHLFEPALAFRASTDAARRYWRLIGSETLEQGDLAALLPDVSRTSSNLMTNELADDLRHWLVEPDFAAEQRRRPFLDARQRLIVETRTNQGYRRVRGPAGSGKTLALAGRAATLTQLGKDILVVSYNLTLINYLKDAAARSGADCRRITWMSFHEWCRRTLIQLGRESDYKNLFRGASDDDSAESLNDVLDEALPALVREVLAGAPTRHRFDAVLVDEGQDMLPSWWEALRLVVKDEPDGEMLLVADRGQDVYLRNAVWTEEAMLGGGFSGPWFELKTSYRMPRQVTELARVFLERFLPDPETSLPEPPEQQELDTDACHLSWLQVAPSELRDATFEAIRRMVVDSRQDDSSDLAFADVVLLCDRLELGRDVHRLLQERNVQVTHTFSASARDRRAQKQRFFKGSERVKGTTLHSFKGWEGRALVVAVGQGTGTAARRALYTGLTRLKAHPHGSHLTVVCADQSLRSFGKLWPEFSEPNLSDGASASSAELL